MCIRDSTYTFIKNHKKITLTPFKESSNKKTKRHHKVPADKGRRNVQFKPGDLVWIQLRKERFPFKRKSKLLPRSDGPFEVLEKVNPNAYKIDLPGDYGVSATFNVADLSPYYDAEEDLPSLRSNSSLAGEDDGDHPTDQPKSKHVQMLSKEVDYLAAHLEHVPAGPSRHWPTFVTLVT